MNFLRKLFPIKKNDTATRNTTDTQRIDDENSHSNINSNVLEINSILNNYEGEINSHIAVDHISDDVIHELDSDKTFHVLTNVPPIESSRNDDGYYGSDDNSNSKVNENNISKEVLNENGVALVQNVVNASQIAEINSSNVIDEVNLQLKEFEEVLVNIDDFFTTDTLETQCSLNSNELDDILNEIDNANEELHEEINNNGVPDETDGNNNMDVNKMSNNSEIIEVISINSSTDNENEESKQLITVNSDSESCEGYNSSDFEFISEAEARMDGFIINFKQNGNPENLEQFDGYPGQFAEELFGESDPGEGTSNQNRPKNEFEDRTYRDNHQIPEGDNYLELFQGLYNPLMAVSEIYFLENKSVRTSAMNSQYDGMGFDKQLALRRHQPDSSEDEFADDAKETAGKILNMYPRENRKKRRRR